MFQLFRAALLLPSLALAADTFDATSGEVQLPLVIVGSDLYTVTMQHLGNLQFQVTTLEPATSGDAGDADRYDADSGELHLSEVVYAADRYEVELQYQGDLLFSVTGATPLSLGGETLFYAPAPIAEVLGDRRSASWSALGNEPTDLTRCVIAPAGSGAAVVLTEADNAVVPELSLDNGMTAAGSVTNDRLLRAMFQFIADGDGYRVVAVKHSNYAIDLDSGDRLILRDIRSGHIDSTVAAYLQFQATPGDDGYTLTATGRKIYQTTSGEFEDDASWSARTVTVTDGALYLASGTATTLKLYEPPIDLSIPFDLNPDGIARVSNPEVTPQSRADDPIAETPLQVVDAYRDQVAAAGPDDATRAAAEAMLTTIQQGLASEGLALRYPAEFYLAFRDGLLARTLQTADSTDGELGQLTVPYVYFTNASDGEGSHHPFLVIASYDLPDAPALLWDVAKPPGDGLTADYPSQSVTRSYHREAFLMKIPLRDYGIVSYLTENNMVNDLASDVGVTDFDHHNYASVSATGVAIDGVVIYPSYNNALHFAQSEAELSAHGMHSGRGLGVHYHADGYAATGDGLTLYNDGDYSGRSHPPLVSLGFDGVAGYGIYRAGDTGFDGFDVALDDFGGHRHGDYGYHYHAYSESAVTPESVAYTVHVLPPQGAWAGRINAIPEFWQGTSPNYVGGRSVYLGTEAE
ncbi:hypothetical protein [Endothiovibrio diazotrophicus]